MAGNGLSSAILVSLFYSPLVYLFFFFLVFLSYLFKFGSSFLQKGVVYLFFFWLMHMDLYFPRRKQYGLFLLTVGGASSCNTQTSSTSQKWNFKYK